jgi:hypothetical protein
MKREKLHKILFMTNHNAFNMASSVDNSYVYRPLKSSTRFNIHDVFRSKSQKASLLGRIRVFVLEPGFGNSPLLDNLMDRKLSSHLRYETLSYAWDDPNNTRMMQICGKDIEITESLDTALRHLRFEDRPRTLWVDALCINQKDVEEKSAQIPLMAKIYQTASCVLVWLGKEDDSTDLAFKTLEEVGLAAKTRIWMYMGQKWQIPWRNLQEKFVRKYLPMTINYDRNPKAVLPRSGPLLSDMLDAVSTMPHIPRDAEFMARLQRNTLEEFLTFFGHSSIEDLNMLERTTALQKMFQDHSWWSRTWVIQEILNAKKKCLHLWK